jgi:hypothetical protein
MCTYDEKYDDKTHNQCIISWNHAGEFILLRRARRSIDIENRRKSHLGRGFFPTQSEKARPGQHCEKIGNFLVGLDSLVCRWSLLIGQCVLFCDNGRYFMVLLVEQDTLGTQKAESAFFRRHARHHYGHFKVTF